MEHNPFLLDSSASWFAVPFASSLITNVGHANQVYQEVQQKKLLDCKSQSKIQGRDVK